MLTAKLKKHTLAEGTELEDALWQLRLFEDFVSVCLKDSVRSQSRDDGQSDRTNDPADRESGQAYDRLCQRMLHTMLYGLIARD